MQSVTVSVVTELLAHDHGHWCSRCLRSTGIRAWVAVRIGGALSLQIRAWCQDCGSRDVEVSADGRHC